MLRKINRADKKTVDKIFKACPPNGREGRFLSSPSLTFKYLRTLSPTPRISFIAPKNTAKLAFKRNILRRSGYKALAKHFTSVPRGTLGAFIFRKYQDDVHALENEIEAILHKIDWFVSKIYFSPASTRLCFLPHLFGVHEAGDRQVWLVPGNLSRGSAHSALSPLAEKSHRPATIINVEQLDFSLFWYKMGLCSEIFGTLFYMSRY